MTLWNLFQFCDLNPPPICVFIITLFPPLFPALQIAQLIHSLTSDRAQYNSLINTTNKRMVYVHVD